MKTYDTNGEFKKALEKYLGHTIINSVFEKLIIDRHPPYSDADLLKLLSSIGGSVKTPGRKTLPEIIKAIAEELALWQEIKLHFLEPQLREVRQAMFGSPKHLSIKKSERTY